MKRVIALVACAFLLTPALPASASDEVYPIVFPVDGPNRFSDTHTALKLVIPKAAR